MTKVNSGQDAQAACLGGDIAGKTGTTTSAPTATTVSDTGSSWTNNQWVGHIVVMGGVYGVITSNNATVLTIDRWYQPGSPGGAAGTTPGSAGTYTILPGNAPYWYMALTANTTTPNVADTSLTGEYTTAGGGLIRQICTYAHTSGATSYSLGATFTANSNDVPNLPITIAKIGIFNTLTGATGRMMFETPLTATATLSASGDQLTVTDTVSM